MGHTHWQLLRARQLLKRELGADRILLLSGAISWQEESSDFTFKLFGLKLDLSSLSLINLSEAGSLGHMK